MTGLLSSGHWKPNTQSENGAMEGPTVNLHFGSDVNTSFSDFYRKSHDHIIITT